MSISGALSSAVSGLTDNIVRLAAAANNIVNAQTADYAASQVQSSTVASVQAGGGTYTPGGVQPIILEDGAVDIATEFVRMILAENAYRANIETIRTAEEMSRELIDIKT